MLNLFCIGLSEYRQIKKHLTHGFKNWFPSTSGVIGILTYSPDRNGAFRVADKQHEQLMSLRKLFRKLFLNHSF